MAEHTATIAWTRGSDENFLDKRYRRAHMAVRRRRHRARLSSPHGAAALFRRRRRGPEGLTWPPCRAATCSGSWTLPAAPGCASTATPMAVGTMAKDSRAASWSRRCSCARHASTPRISSAEQLETCTTARTQPASWPARSDAHRLRAGAGSGRRLTMANPNRQFQVQDAATLHALVRASRSPRSWSRTKALHANHPLVPGP